MPNYRLSFGTSPVNERRYAMTLPAVPHIELNRACVRSKVIEANLRDLGDALSLANGDLGDDVRTFTRDFGKFVIRLGHASDAAAEADKDRRA